MEVTCPQCDRSLPPEDVNVDTDVAYCDDCREAYKLSELFTSRPDKSFDLKHPPKGVWFSQEYDGFTVGASTRSAIALFLVPFTCVWSGLTVGGIYGTQIAAGEFTLFLSLLGIPFILGTIAFGRIALMKACGKVVVQVDRDTGTVFTGIGPIGWTRRFAWSDVKTIREQGIFDQSYTGERYGIILDGRNLVKIPFLSNKARRYYMLQALRQKLNERDRR